MRDVTENSFDKYTAGLSDEAIEVAAFCAEKFFELAAEMSKVMSKQHQTRDILDGIGAALAFSLHSHEDVRKNLKI